MIVPSLPRWVNTLKFKIVAMAVLAGVLSAVVTTQFVLATTKTDMLQTTLTAVVRKVRPEMWQDTQAMAHFLVEKPALNMLFDNVDIDENQRQGLSGGARRKSQSQEEADAGAGELGKNPLCVLPHRCRAAMTATLHMGLEPLRFSSLNGARKG